MIDIKFETTYLVESLMFKNATSTTLKRLWPHCVVPLLLSCLPSSRSMIAFFVYFFVVMVTKGLFAKHFSICAKSRNPREIELLTLPAARFCVAATRLALPFVSAAAAAARCT